VVKIIFVFGAEIFSQNEFQENLKFDETIGIVYFPDTHLSYEYAKSIAKENDTSFIIKIDSLFKNFSDEIYSFSLGENTVHLTKIGKKIQTSLSTFGGNLEPLEDFLLKKTKIMSFLFQLTHTKWVFSIFLHFASKIFWPVFIFSIFYILFLSYKIKFLGIDLERKVEIYKLFFSNK